MSRSNSQYTEQTTTTTSSAPGMTRNYSNQDYPNSQYRSNPSYNRDTDYDDARHHGRWTASGESRDLTDTSSARNRDRDHDRNDRNRDHDRRDDRSRDYERRDRDSDRNRMSGSGYNSGFDSSYGPQSSFGSHPSSGFGSHPGMSGFGSHPSMYGSHPSSGYGMPYESHYGSSYSHPMSSGVSQFPASFPHYGASSYEMSSYPHSSYGMMSPSHYGSSYGMMPHHMGSSIPVPPPMPHHMGSGLGSSSRSLNRSVGGQTPECDIYEVGNDYIIELDLPGHSREHIDTKLYGNELHISSKPPKRSHNFHMNERGLGHSDVNRRLYLPQDAHTGNINASLTNGVLKIVIPRNISTVTPTGVSTTTPISTVILPASSTSTQPTTTLIKDTTTTTTETKRI